MAEAKREVRPFTLVGKELFVFSSLKVNKSGYLWESRWFSFSFCCEETQTKKLSASNNNIQSLNI